MGHKHRHKKHYYSVTDRLWFKIAGSVLTAVIFGLLYFLVVILMENPGLAPVFSIPCVLMVIWVAAKQRQFWWLWVPVATLCFGLTLAFRNQTVRFYLTTIYWVTGYAMTQWLIVSDSRAKHQSKRRKSSRHHQHSHEPVPPRPRDELLEQLLGDAP